jgi:hypothetical protein
MARNITAALPNCLILIWSIFIGCPTAVTADDVGAAGDEAVVPAPAFATTWPSSETAFGLCWRAKLRRSQTRTPGFGQWRPAARGERPWSRQQVCELSLPGTMSDNHQRDGSGARRW